jgi:hypothetical protein
VLSVLGLKGAWGVISGFVEVPILEWTSGGSNRCLKDYINEKSGVKLIVKTVCLMSSHAQAYLSFLSSDTLNNSLTFTWRFDSCAFGPPIADNGRLLSNPNP